MTGKPSAQRQFGRQENIRAQKPSRTQEDCAEPDFTRIFGGSLGASNTGHSRAEIRSDGS